jgi:hypothetical protein
MRLLRLESLLVILEKEEMEGISLFSDREADREM